MKWWQIHLIVLSSLTLAACFFICFILFVLAWGGIDSSWLTKSPELIVAANVLSIPLYIYALSKGWKYVYNTSINLICITLSLHYATPDQFTTDDRVFVTSITLGILGITTSILFSFFSRKKRKKGNSINPPANQS
ncbi:hypothetical protein M0R36_03240 [bacterium]|nr:hypothetical protein [bacterium]